MKRFNSYKNNVLLLKDDVGRPKPTTRKLPNNFFSFGKPEIRDAEDAGQGKSTIRLTHSLVPEPRSDSVTISGAFWMLITLSCL